MKKMGVNGHRYAAGRCCEEGELKGRSRGSRGLREIPTTVKQQARDSSQLQAADDAIPTVLLTFATARAQESIMSYQHLYKKITHTQKPATAGHNKIG